MSLQTYKNLDKHHSEDHRMAIGALSPIIYCGQEVMTADDVHNARAYLPCIEADMGSPISTPRDDLKVADRRNDVGRYAPMAHRLREERLDGRYDSSKRWIRKGVQVPYSVTFFALPDSRQVARNRKPARKARWPYMA